MSLAGGREDLVVQRDVGLRQLVVRLIIAHGSTALSGPGAQSYQAYWCRAVAQAILTRPANKVVTINDITEQTYMIPEDVVGTLLHMGVLGSKKKDGSIKLDRADIRAWLKENKIDLAPPVDADGFVEWVEESNSDDCEQDMEE